MNKQSTLDPNGDVKIYSKKIIKRYSAFHHPTEAKDFDGILKELEEKHHRTKYYSLFSGGKDSMTVAHKLAESGKLEKIVHIKTGVGLSMTTDFVHDICQEYGWKYQIIEPTPIFTYASHVMQYGFPGPGFHNKIMGKLKFKTMRDFALSADRKNHCLISGVRKFESDRRNAKYPYPIISEGSLWFCSPIFYYTNEEVQKYVMVNELKTSPAYKAGLSTSGECMCGSFAGRGEKELIRQLDPKLADYIKWLEDGIQRFGTSHAKEYPKWGGQTKMSELEQQQQLDAFTKENPEFDNLDELEALTCGSECGPGTMRGNSDF